MNQEQINENLKNLPGWRVAEGKLKKEFEFKDFKQAIIFINGLAMLAESVSHHPDIHIYYNKVVLELRTHSENGLTEKDFDLAKLIEKNLNS